MKLNLKMIAAAAALATLGTANAALLPNNTPNSGSSFALLAFDTATRAYYIRDLGYVLNTFMPNSVTTLAGDGTGAVATTGDKTPSTGLTLDATSNPGNFADASFGTWLAGQTAANIRWVTIATDNLSAAANGVSRLITSSAAALVGTTNGTVTNYVAASAGGGLSALFGSGSGISATGTALASWADINGGLGANTLSTLGQSSGLYYVARSAQSGSGLPLAPTFRYGNAAGFASVSLAANGDFSYTLAPESVVAPVPLPASLWLMGAGLAAIGGMVRRRRAAVQA